MKPQSLPDEVLTALEKAKRTQGWSGRSGEVQRFQLDGCTLHVVLARRWAYRRQERQTLPVTEEFTPSDAGIRSGKYSKGPNE